LSVPRGQSVTFNNTICPDGSNSNLSSPQTCLGHGGGL
jgi:hypothetical protein